jgi:voltage-gated potassium channel
MASPPRSERDPRRERLHEIIFEADTPAGRTFDIILLVLILLSIITVMLESSERWASRYGDIFTYLEWSFTILFTIEYFLRIYSVYRPRQYMTSFFGIIDLLAILPTYISYFFAGTQYLLVVRGLRLLRVFRIFKLGHFLKEGEIIMDALRASRAKIIVFLFFVSVLVIIIGSVMYLVEGTVNNPGFSSIPRAIYWAIVTLTTVGYGDITPQTDVGQFLSAIVMILGYAIIAVPTGIVTGEMIRKAGQSAEPLTTQACRFCGREGHDSNALYCKYCGERLND